MRMLLLFAALITSLATATAAEPLRLYLSPAGDDSANGLGSERPIRTLNRAQEIVVQFLKDKPNDAEILIASGNYSSQSVKWSFYVPDHTITFKAAVDDGNRPVFKGQDKGTWFTFAGHTEGARTGLVFQNLRVEHYATAISFSGNRNLVKSSSRGNTISGCHFVNVGEDSTAAVRFVNSSSNCVTNCHFISIVRRRSPGLLHAIYAAHNCVENQIIGNQFETCCGDPIRFRDGSNRNRVMDNRFIRTGVEAAVSDWFCDHDEESNCTKPTPECPSWNNVVTGNFIDRTFRGGNLDATKVYSSRIPKGCTAPLPEAKRFIVSDNRKP